MTDQYVDRKYARASYRPRNIMSPGLQRAREPFRLRNTITGFVLMGFAVSVWAYSISAVKQDAFDDVDEEARALMAGSGMQKSENGAAEGRGAVDASKTTVHAGTLPTDSVSSPTPDPSTKLASSPRHGILPPLLEHRFPGFLDPSTGTLVWSAHSMNDIGRPRDSGVGSKRV